MSSVAIMTTFVALATGSSPSNTGLSGGKAGGIVGGIVGGPKYVLATRSSATGHWTSILPGIASFQMSLHCLKSTYRKQNLTEKDLKWSNIYIIMKDICAGLSFIHSQNEIHRDLKPTTSNRPSEF